MRNTVLECACSMTRAVTKAITWQRGRRRQHVIIPAVHIQCRGGGADPLRLALRIPRNTSRRDIRIETANTNVPLMHRAAWIRNRRQASRRVASARWSCAEISTDLKCVGCACASASRFIANVHVVHCEISAFSITHRALCFREMRAD